MSNKLSRPTVIDRESDDTYVKLLKDRIRTHLDDYLDLAEVNPQLIQDWKQSPTLNDHGQWESDEDCAEAERIRVAAYSHFLSRHPEATTREASEAYASYSSIVRGHWIEKE